MSATEIIMDTLALMCLPSICDIPSEFQCIAL